MKSYSKNLPFIQIKGKMRPICPVCEGTGSKRVKVPVFCPHDDHAYMEESRICSRCHGNGYLIIGEE